MFARSSIQFSLFSSAHVPLDEHLMQACLDDTGHETAIVSSDSLYCAMIRYDPHVRGRQTHLDALGVHLVILFRFRPVKTSITLFADQKIWVIYFLEFQLDWFDEFCCDIVCCLGT